jgi:hypothetical protein
MMLFQVFKLYILNERKIIVRSFVKSSNDEKQTQNNLQTYSANIFAWGALVMTF